MIKATRANAIKAKCHDCTGGYEDGKVDCENPSCPLYLFMQFRRMDPDLDWTNYSFKMKGKVRRDSIKGTDNLIGWRKVKTDEK